MIRITCSHILPIKRNAGTICVWVLSRYTHTRVHRHVIFVLGKKENCRISVKLVCAVRSKFPWCFDPKVYLFHLPEFESVDGASGVLSVLQVFHLSSPNCASLSIYSVYWSEQLGSGCTEHLHTKQFQLEAGVTHHAASASTSYFTDFMFGFLSMAELCLMVCFKHFQGDLYRWKSIGRTLTVSKSWHLAWITVVRQHPPLPSLSLSRPHSASSRVHLHHKLAENREGVVYFL